jgi:uncharacterized membrane protein YuzA (DUF378 family)
MKILNWIMLILLVVGGVNRGLYAWLDLNLVALVFPDIVTKSVDATGIESTVTTISMLAKIVYSLVTVGALRTLVGEIKKA